jgi:hypothetical protein
LKKHSRKNQKTASGASVDSRSAKKERGHFSKRPLLLAALFFLAVPGLLFFQKKAVRSVGERKTVFVPGSLTFNKDIAPILWENCSGCHRPGQSGPFNLITYDDVRKHAADIDEVIGRRFMPPWPPAPGYNEFIGQRVLDEGQRTKLRQWIADGTPEGKTGDLPVVPKWNDEWTLGKPDLVVTLPMAYRLPAEGRDIYRNFVVPIPTSEGRFIKAVDFRPGSKSVHHAFMLFDRTRKSRRLDEETPEPGFGGMSAPGSAQSPSGQFLSWQPGKVPRIDQNTPSWKLNPDTDLVLQIHMQPTGRPEPVQPSVAFYFTDQPSTNISFKMGFDSFSIDIPAGATNYLVRDSYRLPVDVEVMAVLPHAHYLGKTLQSYALLPDGSKKSLLYIPEWNFSWQGDYRYIQPIFVPKGSTIEMEFSYDNSTNNLRNPQRPPQRVQYGVQTTDEMANLDFIFRLANARELEILERDYQYKAAKDIISYNEYALRQNPRNAHAHTQLGKVFLALGRRGEAQQQLEQATALDPRSDDAHYHLAVLLEDLGKLAEAKEEYEAALRENPDHLPASNNLGLLCLRIGDLDSAQAHFENAKRVGQEEVLFRGNFELLRKARQSAKSNARR